MLPNAVSKPPCVPLCQDAPYTSLYRQSCSCSKSVDLLLSLHYSSSTKWTVESIDDPHNSSPASFPQTMLCRSLPTAWLTARLVYPSGCIAQLASMYNASISNLARIGMASFPLSSNFIPAFPNGSSLSTHGTLHRLGSLLATGRSTREVQLVLQISSTAHGSFNCGVETNRIFAVGCAPMATSLSIVHTSTVLDVLPLQPWVK
jgi:hypothetical protein